MKNSEMIIQPTIFFKIVITLFLCLNLHSLANLAKMKVSIETQACKKSKAYRKKLELSQNEVAEALNMSQNSYSLIELGKTRITVERLYQVAIFFKISVIDLLPPPTL